MDFLLPKSGFIAIYPKKDLLDLLDLGYPKQLLSMPLPDIIIESTTGAFYEKE